MYREDHLLSLQEEGSAVCNATAFEQSLHVSTDTYLMLVVFFFFNKVVSCVHYFPPVYQMWIQDSVNARGRVSHSNTSERGRVRTWLWQYYIIIMRVEFKACLSGQLSNSGQSLCMYVCITMLLIKYTRTSCYGSNYRFISTYIQLLRRRRYWLSFQ